MMCHQINEDFKKYLKNDVYVARYVDSSHCYPILSENKSIFKFSYLFLLPRLVLSFFHPSSYPSAKRDITSRIQCNALGKKRKRWKEVEKRTQYLRRLYSQI